MAAEIVHLIEEELWLAKINPFPLKKQEQYLVETQTARLRVLCRALHFTVIGGGESHEEQSALSTSSSESTRNDCHVCQEQQDVFKMLKNNQKGPRITYWQAKLDLGVSWALQLSLSNYKDYSEKFEEAYNTLVEWSAIC